MAKRNNRVRSSVVDSREVGDPEEIDKIINGEFNPVKSKLAGMTVKEVLESFAEYYSNDARTMPECIDSFLDSMDEQVEESKIKKTLPYDRSRIEFLRMQIGPVQQFFMTLGNVLFSASERIGSLEQQVYTLSLKDKMMEEYNVLCAAQGRVVSMDEFKKHWEENCANKKS